MTEEEAHRRALFPGLTFEPVKDERPELERYKSALERIVKHEGKVCPEFELCSHPACNSSYSAWEIANHGLRGWKLPDEEGRVTEEADHLRTLVKRLMGERPILVERSILACTSILIRKLEDESVDSKQALIIRSLLDDLQKLDKEEILE